MELCIGNDCRNIGLLLALGLVGIGLLGADLAREHPQAGRRVERAALIVLWDVVERGAAPGQYWVDSESEPDKQYLVLRKPGQPATCLCQDHQRHGSLTPCKHILSTLLLERAERLDADQSNPTLDAVDVYGEPIPFTLTPQAITLLDEHRQRQAAKCPDCGEFKQHGDLYCTGDRCAAAV